MKTRKQMIEFLTGHFRYNTLNGWNNATSYAVRVKIHDFVPRELQDKAFDLLDVPETFDTIHELIREFGAAHGYQWQAGFNGRSGGYLVLYQGSAKPSAWKSRCGNCGQRNFTSVKETGRKCGVCHKDARNDYETPPLEISTSAVSVDGDGDFSEWDSSALRARVKLVKEFDALAEACKKEFLYYCRTYKVEEETVMVPRKVKKLTEVQP